MDNEDKDDKKISDEDSFFQDDYDEDPIDYDLNADKFLEEDIFEPDLTKNWEKPDRQEDSPFDDELEFEEDLGPDLEDEDDFDSALDDPEDEWQDDELDSQDENYSQPWPLGLFAAGIIALLLLAAGGYGVMEQRLETQKEVRLLRAKLATTTSNTEVAESRQSQRNLQIHNEELEAKVEVLQSQVAALHEEISRQDSAVPRQSADPVPPPPAPKVIKPAKPAAVNKAPAETKTSAPVAQGGWFVNFGSYKSKATADSWASKLSVDAGRVAVVSGDKKGTLYYRVRVLDLPNKAIAGKIALQLEQTHHLSPRWVGKQQ
jgi:cell division protein FtsN